MHNLSFRNFGILSFAIIDRTFKSCQEIDNKMLQFKKNLVLRIFKSIELKGACETCKNDVRQNYLTSFFYLLETSQKNQNLTSVFYALSCEGLQFDVLNNIASLIHFIYPPSYEFETYE